MNEYPSWTDLGRSDLSRSGHPSVTGPRSVTDDTSVIDLTDDADDADGTDHLTVVTPVQDDRDLAHLRAQLWGLTRQHRPADRHVIVRMGGSRVTDTLIGAGVDLTTITVVDVPVGSSSPVGASAAFARAAARDLGLRHADPDGTAVLLDPACIPSPELLWHYGRASVTTGGVVTGPVVELPPIPLCGPSDLLLLASYGPADRRVDDGEVIIDDRRQLPWPGSVAAPTEVLRRVAAVEGDLATRVAAVGERLHHVGGAATYRQHPASAGRPLPADDATAGDVATTTTTTTAGR